MKYDYRAKEAHLYAQKKLVDSRSGLALSDEDVLYLDRLITPLLKKGQSIHHFSLITHLEKSFLNLLKAKNASMPVNNKYPKKSITNLLIAITEGKAK